MSRPIDRQALTALLGIGALPSRTPRVPELP